MRALSNYFGYRASREASECVTVFLRRGTSTLSTKKGLANKKWRILIVKRKAGKFLE